MGVLDDHRTDVEQMLAEGASASQVGARYGVSRNTVIGWVSRRGVTNRNRVTSAAPSSALALPRVVDRTPVYERLTRAKEQVLAEFAKAPFKPAAVKLLALRYGLTQTDMRNWLEDNGASDVPATMSKGGGSRASTKSGALPEFKPPQRKGKPFLDAGIDECRYPLWSHEKTSGFVCAQPVARRRRNGKTVSLSWCEECLKIVSAVPVKTVAPERKKVSGLALRRV